MKMIYRQTSDASQPLREGFPYCLSKLLSSMPQKDRIEMGVFSFPVAHQ